MNYENLRRPDVTKLTLAGSLFENEDQPCLISSRSSLVSSNNNTIQRLKKLLLSGHSHHILIITIPQSFLTPSSPFQLPSVWEMMNSKDLRRPDVTKLTQKVNSITYFTSMVLEIGHYVEGAGKPA